MGKNIDWADVGVSAVQGGIDGHTLGGSRAYSGYVASAVKAGIDVKGGKFSMFGGNKLGTNDKHWVQCVGDFASGASTTFMGNILGMNKLDFGGFSNNWKTTFSNQLTEATFTGSFNGVFSFGANQLVRDPLTRFLYMNFTNASVSAGYTEATEIQIDSYKAKLTKYSNKYWYYENQ